jgi:protein tyrosine phosphatase (PTP) superfamily phosphohydrolase (DUF442 family)
MRRADGNGYRFNSRSLATRPKIDPMNLMLLIGVLIMTLSIRTAAFADGIGDTAHSKRPSQWAQPVKLEGVPNLHRITDGLYRSAQPSALGMKKLKALGMETVVNLRSFHSDRDEIGDLGLAYEHIYMKAWHPEEKEAVRFLQIVTNPRRTPVLFHCQHGADRTGTMCALYRVAIQGWSKEAAIREMTQGGYGFHGIWQNLIDWIYELDIDRIKKRAGIS